MLKLSGEVLRRRPESASIPMWSPSLAGQVQAWSDSGVQVAIVVGGGNFFRGAELPQRGHGP